MYVCVSFSFLRCEEHNTVKERKSLQCVFYMSLCECVYMYVAGCVCACVCVRVCVYSRNINLAQYLNQSAVPAVH